MKKYILIIYILTFISALSCMASPISEDTSSSDSKALGTAEINLQLLEAARAGDYDLVLSLINSGADVNTQNEQGATALMLAALNGHTEVLKILIQSKADVNMQANANNGWTALMLSA